MRKKVSRNLQFHENGVFKIINRNPEIRFRVVRESSRKVMRSKIMKEFAK